MSVLITHDPIDTQSLIQAVTRPDCGAVVAFEGRVRNHHEGRQVSHLSYEAYEPMAVKVIQEILDRSIPMFGIRQAGVIHRLGSLEIGDIAVAVVTASPHRKEAFLACSWIMDELKHTAPIWKKECYVDGSTDWVFCRHGRADLHDHASHLHEAGHHHA